MRGRHPADLRGGAARLGDHGGRRCLDRSPRRRTRRRRRRACRHGGGRPGHLKECIMTSAKAIEAFLDNPSLAVVGVSRSGKGFGNLACRVLRTKGYRVYPVNWSTPTVDGVRCYARLRDLPERVNAALVVVTPAQAVEVVREAA